MFFFTAAVFFSRKLKIAAHYYVEIISLASLFLIYWLQFKKIDFIYFVYFIGTIFLLFQIIKYLYLKKHNGASVAIIVISFVIFWHYKPLFLPVLMFLFARLLQYQMEVSSSLRFNFNFGSYLSYLFYFPTYLSGPINSYKKFIEDATGPISIKYKTADVFSRLAWGVIKLFFLSAVVLPLTPSAYLMDGLYHNIIEMLFSCLAAYIYFYMNMSGLYDIVISLSSIAGINLPENFNKPYTATNISEFWKRWHITLGEFLKNIIFFPLQKYLIKVSPNNKFITTVTTYFFVMLGMGLLSGVHKNYFIYGILNGFALSAHFVYLNYVKKNNFVIQKLLSFRFYNSLCWLITQSFICLSLLLYDLKFDHFVHLMKMIIYN